MTRLTPQDGKSLLHHPTRMLGILPTHGPRAFGWALAVGFDGIELVVI
jgi:hypothetical protein